MIRYKRLPVSIVWPNHRRFSFHCVETGVSGEVFKKPGGAWTATVPGGPAARDLTREDACRRVLNLAVSAGAPQ